MLIPTDPQSEKAHRNFPGSSVSCRYASLRCVLKKGNITDWLSQSSKESQSLKINQSPFYVLNQKFVWNQWFTRNIHSLKHVLSTNQKMVAKPPKKKTKDQWFPHLGSQSGTCGCRPSIGTPAVTSWWCLPSAIRRAMARWCKSTGCWMKKWPKNGM